MGVNLEAHCISLQLQLPAADELEDYLPAWPAYQGQGQRITLPLSVPSAGWDGSGGAPSESLSHPSPS